MPGVGRTSWDATGLSSTNRNRVKVARTSVENGPQSHCSVTEAEFRPLLLWLSEEAQQTARESCQRTKAQKYHLSGANPQHPITGDTETLPKEGFLSIGAAGPSPRRQAEKPRSPQPGAPEWHSHQAPVFRLGCDHNVPERSPSSGFSTRSLLLPLPLLCLGSLSC